MFRDGNWQADCTIAISCHHEFRACSRIRTTELKATLNLLEPICTRSPPSPSHPETPHTHKCRTEAEKQRITPRLAPKHLDAFQVLWPLGIPISVDLPQNADYEPYSVANLRTLHGTEEALVSCCDFSPQKAGWRWKSAVMQLRWYLMAFARSETEDGPNLVIKIEELPQHESLA
ncbi:hypothetical protein BC629DRAFT_165964 [Irpex lacteus]|nr:hypothetical protein BC629DRAFT_165964 [Irpex lacteus]